MTTKSHTFQSPFDPDKVWRAVALEPTQHPWPIDWDVHLVDEIGRWAVVRVDDYRGAHPTDPDARGEWHTRRVTYQLVDDAP